MAEARRVPRSLILSALLLALSVGGVYSFVSMSIANRTLRHTDEVRAKVALLRATLLDAETGLRGYLLTGAQDFLAPYERAHRSWRAQLDEVQRLTSDNPDQQARLRSLEKVITDEFAGFTQERATREHERAGREPLTLLAEHKRTMDAARVLLADMEREEVLLDRIREREATRRWGLTAAFFIAGTLTFFAVVMTFARQRRQSEMRTQRAEEEQRLLRAVFAGIDDGITLQDRSGKLIFANAGAARMIGYPTPAALLAAPGDEIVARFELHGEDGRPFPPERLPARAVLAGGAPQKAVIRFRTGDSGPWRWSVVDAHPITDADGDVVQVINVFRDVTAEREADERRRFLLRAADELNSSLDYEATLAAVARLAVPTLADWCAVDIVDGEQLKRLATAHVDPNKVSLVSEITRRYPPDPGSRNGAREIVRTGQPQLIPQIPRELLTAAAVDEEHLRLLDSLDLRSYVGVPLSAGGKVLGAMTFVMAESHRVYDENDLSFARALADRAALAIENARLFREVERARAAIAAQLADEERRRRDAEEQARFAETFVGMLGHDLRNPLNAIVMTTRLLKRIATAPNEVNAVDRVQSSALRMSNMVGQLLDLTRSRLAGGITVEKGPIELGGVVSEAVDELRRAYPGRQIAWAGGPGVRADADRDRLAQVFSNLIGNALEHGDPARPVTVELALAADQITLKIHNEGTPIADALLPYLFQPFRRTMMRSERSKGLGLGLFITEQIVRAHGGHIEVASTAERGTTFTVVLPRPDGDLVDSPPQRLVS
jgi:signal transduction histidine kinase